MDSKRKLGREEEGVPVDKGRYQRLVGRLIYLAHTRPDISFVVSVVSQFMNLPLEEHMEVVLGDFGPSQSQKLAHEMRFSLTLINSSPTPSTTDVG